MVVVKVKIFARDAIAHTFGECFEQFAVLVPALRIREQVRTLYAFFDLRSQPLLDDAFEIGVENSQNIGRSRLRHLEPQCLFQSP